MPEADRPLVVVADPIDAAAVEAAPLPGPCRGRRCHGGQRTPSAGRPPEAAWRSSCSVMRSPDEGQRRSPHAKAPHLSVLWRARGSGVRQRRPCPAATARGDVPRGQCPERRPRWPSPGSPWCSSSFLAWGLCIPRMRNVDTKARRLEARGEIGGGAPGERRSGFVGYEPGSPARRPSGSPCSAPAPSAYDPAPSPRRPTGRRCLRPSTSSLPRAISSAFTRR